MIRRVLHRINYKAGWVFEVLPVTGMSRYYRLVITIATVDSQKQDVSNIRTPISTEFVPFWESAPVDFTMQWEYQKVDRPIQIMHAFDIPWVPDLLEHQALNWILERIINVETHEACEFLKVDGKSVFMPEHGPGADSYTVKYLEL